MKNAWDILMIPRYFLVYPGPMASRPNRKLPFCRAIKTYGDSIKLQRAERELSCIVFRSETIIVAGMAKDWSHTPGHHPCTPLASQSYKAPYYSRSKFVAS